MAVNDDNVVSRVLRAGRVLRPAVKALVMTMNAQDEQMRGLSPSCDMLCTCVNRTSFVPLSLHPFSTPILVGRGWRLRGRVHYENV